MVVKQRQAFPTDRHVRLNLYSIKCTLSTESLTLKPLDKVSSLFVLKSELAKRSYRQIDRQAIRRTDSSKEARRRTDGDRQTDRCIEKQTKQTYTL